MSHVATTAASSRSSVCGTSRSGRQLAGQRFATSAQNWRRVGHIIADQVYKQLTGESGYFDTRVVFVDETGPKDRRVKRLAIMDQDGFNVRLLSKGRSSC